MEDNASDVFLIRSAVEEAKLPAEISVVRDGEKALKVFDDADRDAAAVCPDLVILDINLPKRQGTEVLQRIRQSPRCGQTLVVVVTTSDSAGDRERMSRLGANAYFRKPSEYDDFLNLGQVITKLLKS